MKNLFRVLFFLLPLPGFSVESLNPDDLQAVVTSIEKMEAWRKDAQICPAELMQSRQSLEYLKADSCKTDLMACLSSCERRDGAGCYWLAYALQRYGTSPKASEVLYQQSCKLGIMSGCTNRAAGMESDNPMDAATMRCSIETYRRVCDFDDPWACTMYAFRVSRGIGVKPDQKAALRALEKSCRYGREDTACEAGMRLKASHYTQVQEALVTC